MENIDAVTIAQAFYEEIVTRHFTRFLSDAASTFLCPLMKEIYRMFDTQKLTTSAYHPQCDGLVERLNGTLAISLTAYANKNQNNWCEYLPSFLMAYRTTTASAHGITPFYMLYGRKARLPVDFTNNLGYMIAVISMDLHSQFTLSLTATPF